MSNMSDEWLDNLSKWTLNFNYPSHIIGGESYIIAWYQLKGSSGFGYHDNICRAYTIQRHD